MFKIKDFDTRQMHNIIEGKTSPTEGVYENAEFILTMEFKQRAVS